MKTENIGGKDYKVSESGTFYHVETPDKVIDVLENVRYKGTRILLHWGDVATGKYWGDIYDITGTIGRSTGTAKIPLLIHNRRSMGGGAILTHCILRIKETGKNGRVLYQAENYQNPNFEIKPCTDIPEHTHEVRFYGELLTRHKSLKSAEHLLIRIK